ncbi:hypothetical protein SDJN02_11036, partial [Cucurbita argyrosperma subsp. argyrosperma]
MAWLREPTRVGAKASLHGAIVTAYGLEPSVAAWTPWLDLCFAGFKLSIDVELFKVNLESVVAEALCFNVKT